MNESIEVAEFEACKHLDYNRKKYAPSVNMALISHRQASKVTWERIDVDGKMCLVQFCVHRGRLNYPTACLGESEPYVCSLFEIHKHSVPLSDVSTE